MVCIMFVKGTIIFVTIGRGYIVIRSARSPWILLLLLIAGALVGSAIAQSLSMVPYIHSTASFGITPPAVLDLHFASLTFGFSITLGPLTALGMILGLVIYRRI